MREMSASVIKKGKGRGANPIPRHNHNHNTSTMKFETPSFLDEGVFTCYGEAAVVDSEFTAKHDTPGTYHNLCKALGEYCPSMSIPHYTELRRYTLKDKSLVVKRDDHMLALFIHHSEKIYKRRSINYAAVKNIIGHYNDLGKKMNPRRLKIASIRATIKNLQMRDPQFSLRAQYRSRRDSVICELNTILARQPFMVCDEGCRKSRIPRLPCGKRVVDAVVEEAETILAAVPSRSSICNSTIARWAVWKASQRHGLGKMDPDDAPANHPTHRAWLAPLGCIICKNA